MRSGLTRRQVLLSGALAIVATDARAHNGTIHVTIEKMEFTPSQVTARPGETIEWTNKDRVAHTATVAGGWEVMIPVGKVGSRVLEATDQVDYYCRFHPNMKGSITVSA